jgi:hypothetical protein
VSLAEWDPDEPAASSDVALEGSLLDIVEDISGRIEEHHHLASSEFRIREAGRILGAVDGETMVGAERFNGGDPMRDRVVAKTGRLREDEDREPGLRAFSLGDPAERREEDAEDDQQR